MVSKTDGRLVQNFNMFVYHALSLWLDYRLATHGKVLMIFGFAFLSPQFGWYILCQIRLRTVMYWTVI